MILLEPVLGEGGVIPLDAEFVAAAAELPPLLGLDEVQTGVGRTGSFFAFEQLGVRPDLVTLAKGLANGLPIGALLVSDDAPEGARARATTGRRSAATPSRAPPRRAVVDAIDDELLANVRALGAALADGLAELPGVREVRGRGLLLGAVLEGSSGDVVDCLPRPRAARPDCGRRRPSARSAADRRSRGRRGSTHDLEAALTETSTERKLQVVT